MNISGIVVLVPPHRMESSIASLNSLAGVSVHHTDDSTGRIVVTQEAHSVTSEVEGLRRIQALRNVILAELVYHYIEDDAGDPPETPS